jgi:hypothetical protein
MSQNRSILLVILLTILVSPGLGRSVSSYPEGELNAQQIAEQAHLAAHGELVRNAVSKRHKNEVALVINRAPLEKRTAGRKPSVNTFETFVNNRPVNPAIASMQMAILTSGKAQGTGILLTNYRDPQRSSSMLMWLPALRKVRRINQPDPADVWFGTTLTYGELVLRKPEDENHELLGEGLFAACLETMELAPAEMTRYTTGLPEAQCDHRGKPVYRLKSTTRIENWWYDYHISDIDKRTFSLYRTVYFKDEKKIKTVYVDWQSLEQADPRISYPRYIYAVLHENGRDSLVYVPRSTIQIDGDLPDSFWSELTLKKMGR